MSGKYHFDGFYRRLENRRDRRGTLLRIAIELQHLRTSINRMGDGYRVNSVERTAIAGRLAVIRNRLNSLPVGDSETALHKITQHLAGQYTYH